MRNYSAINKLHYLLLITSSLLFSKGDELKAQRSFKVLFLGNSYTSVNNLPQLIHDLALSAGDTLIFDSYAPGGYQLLDHSNDITSQAKIMAGAWDYVVIQGQSQEPVMFPNQFNNGANALYNRIKQYNPCAVVMPYMTWGRKNGDAANCPNFPLMCTYQGMDSALRTRYLNLTASINGEVSPVAVLWKYLRLNYPGIELYQADESHPSAAGSYAAACSFYAMLFKKDPALIAFNFGLPAAEASIIKNAAKTQVFDSLQRWDFKKLPIANFTYQVGPGSNEVMFSPVNQGVRQTYFWDFGDGTTSPATNPTHSYLSNGTYSVSLTTTNCDLQGWHTSTTDTTVQFCNHTPTVFTVHPWLCNLDTLWTQPADAYQWFSYGIPLPETRQYLLNSAYSSSGFSVIAAINGCAELSKPYTQTPEISGYYFDALGDPCRGDTVAFAVLHTNGFLSGLEKIYWYKNGALLPAMTNKDTLRITVGGKYACKVINPNSRCPLDTTSYLIEYDCGPQAPAPGETESFGTVFPNPASGTINIKFRNSITNDQVLVYDATGRLLKLIEVAGVTTLSFSIADLPGGLYLIRLKNNKQPALKFIKQ